jgi:hypothetical protein
MEFKCDTCVYTTNNQSNYRKHVLTEKHKKLVITHMKPEPIISYNIMYDTKLLKTSSNLAQTSSLLAQTSLNVSEKRMTCKYCEQQFKHSSSMARHIKYTCMKNKDEDLKELVRLMNLQLQTKDKQIESQTKQLEYQSRQLETHTKQIEKLMGKLEINSSFNNNTINVTLLSYRDTDVSHLTQEDYRNCYKKVNHCVRHLIEKVHFNPSKPENMNIYISNMKDKYLMVYDGFNWNLANKTDELDRLYEEKEMMLEEWLESNPDPILKEKFMRYLDNKEKDECLNHIKEEIKLMLYNQGNSMVKPLLENVKPQEKSIDLSQF